MWTLSAALLNLWIVLLLFNVTLHGWTHLLAAAAVTTMIVTLIRDHRRGEIERANRDSPTGGPNG